MWTTRLHVGASLNHLKVKCVHKGNLMVPKSVSNYRSFISVELYTGSPPSHDLLTIHRLVFCPYNYRFSFLKETLFWGMFHKLSLSLSECSAWSGEEYGRFKYHSQEPFGWIKSFSSLPLGLSISLFKKKNLKSLTVWLLVSCDVVYGAQRGHRWSSAPLLQNQIKKTNPGFYRLLFKVSAFQ